jgi:hypothetical protein
MAECDCPNPPGGKISCNPNQLAICRVKDGKVTGQCIDPPTFLKVGAKIDARETLRLNNWALTIITGIQRPSAQFVSVADLKMLNDGTYFNPSTDEDITFTLPWDPNNVSNPPLPTPKMEIPPTASMSS